MTLFFGYTLAKSAKGITMEFAQNDAPLDELDFTYTIPEPSTLDRVETWFLDNFAFIFMAWGLVVLVLLIAIAIKVNDR